MFPEPRALARAGEDLAARHLEAHGYHVLGRGLRAGHGEIDLLAEKGTLVVFVEVKTRRGTGRGRPAEALGPRQADSLRRTAASLLASRSALRGRPARFDLIEVCWPDGGEPCLEHLEDVLDGGRWSG